MNEMTTSIHRRSLVAAIAAAGAGALALPDAATGDAKTPSARPLSGQAALVTGAARGIGRAAAVALARAGANVCLLDRADDIAGLEYALASRDDLRETLALVEAAEVDAFTVVADVRDRAAMQAAAAAMTERFGRIDIALPNAGILTMGMLTELSPAAWDDVIAVNLTGVANTMRAVLPVMRRRRYGRIIATASCNGRAGSPGCSSYNASKWGVIGLVKSIAAEEAKHGITVNCVNPTGVATPMTQQPRYVDGFRDFLRGFNAQNRDFLDPGEVAAAMLFFAMPPASVITGEALDVAAGANVRWGA